MAKITKAQIEKFLSAKRIAVIGASRSDKEYSRQLFMELLKHGYEAIPVNPHAEEIAERKCYKRIGDISPPPERALIVLPEELTEQAMIECAEAGVKDVWMHRQIGRGVSDTRAIFRAEERGLNLITGLCMFMFLPKAAFFHKFHGALLKLVGAYPK